MLRKQKDTKPSFSITIKTSNGNTVGFINLVPQFVKVATGKDILNCSANDIANIDGDFGAYFSKLELVIDTKENHKPTIDFEQY